MCKQQRPHLCSTAHILTHRRGTHKPSLRSQLMYALRGQRGGLFKNSLHENTFVACYRNDAKFTLFKEPLKCCLRCAVRSLQAHHISVDHNCRYSLSLISFCYSVPLLSTGISTITSESSGCVKSCEQYPSTYFKKTTRAANTTRLWLGPCNVRSAR